MKRKLTTKQQVLKKYPNAYCTMSGGGIATVYPYPTHGYSNAVATSDVSAADAWKKAAQAGQNAAEDRRYTDPSTGAVMEDAPAAPAPEVDEEAVRLARRLAICDPEGSAVVTLARAYLLAVGRKP